MDTNNEEDASQFQKLIVNKRFLEVIPFEKQPCSMSTSMSFDGGDRSPSATNHNQDMILNSFECIDTFITNQDSFDNALISLQNSMINLSAASVSGNANTVDPTTIQYGYGHGAISEIDHLKSKQDIDHPQSVT